MNYKIIIALACFLASCGSSLNNKKNPENIYSETAQPWKLHWSEEFNYTGLPDSNTWAYNTGGHGWGNNELQYYTSHDSLNAYVNNGTLKITARKNKTGNREYSSARLVTEGKAEFTYGKIEIKAKLPPGIGLWPAIWMLGSNISKAGWPHCGEIDIMEHVGYEKDTVQANVHTGTYNHSIGTGKGRKIFISDPYSQFHLYGFEWTPDEVGFMLDGEKFFEFKNEHKTTGEWPFDLPHFFILNIAVGGNLGGKKVSTILYSPPPWR